MEVHILDLEIVIAKMHNVTPTRATMGDEMRSTEGQGRGSREYSGSDLRLSCVSFFREGRGFPLGGGPRIGFRERGVV